MNKIPSENIQVYNFLSPMRGKSNESSYTSDLPAIFQSPIFYFTSRGFTEQNKNFNTPKIFYEISQSKSDFFFRTSKYVCGFLPIESCIIKKKLEG